MIALALLVTTAQAEPPAATPEEITVVAERIRRFRAVTRKDRKTGATICVVKRPSGDPALDAGICAALLECAPHVRSVPQAQACMAPAMARLVPTLP